MMKKGKKVVLCAMTALLLYIEAVLLQLMSMDWHRSQVQEWPRYLESLSLFWIEACFAAAWTQVLAACIAGCVGQFRKWTVTRKQLPRKSWNCLFFGGAVILAFLIAAACYAGPLYTAAYAAQEDSAAGYAGVFYPLVIAAELVSGFLIWLLWEKLRSQKQKETPGAGTDAQRKGERLLSP